MLHGHLTPPDLLKHSPGASFRISRQVLSIVHSGLSDRSCLTKQDRGFPGGFLQLLSVRNPQGVLEASLSVAWLTQFAVGLGQHDGHFLALDADRGNVAEIHALYRRQVAFAIIQCFFETTGIVTDHGQQPQRACARRVGGPGANRFFAELVGFGVLRLSIQILGPAHRVLKTTRPVLGPQD